MAVYVPFESVLRSDCRDQRPAVRLQAIQTLNRIGLQGLVMQHQAQVTIGRRIVGPAGLLYIVDAKGPTAAMLAV